LPQLDSRTPLAPLARPAWKFRRDTFGCRIAVDLTGTFDERTEGLAIARRYAEQLSLALGVPAFPFYDLLRRDDTAS
jgi:hypothetical protein